MSVGVTRVSDFDIRHSLFDIRHSSFLTFVGQANLE